MIIKRQAYFLLIFLIGCTSAINGTSYTWGLTSGAWNGHSSGNLIADNNAVFLSTADTFTLPDTSTVTQYGIFKPHAGDTLNIVKSVSIKGDVEIRFTGSAPTLDDSGMPQIAPEIFTINIGATNSGSGGSLVLDSVSPVVVSSYTDGATTVDGYSQLIFNPAEGKTILVNMYADLEFQSVDALGGYNPSDTHSVGAPIPLYITFRGRGSTVFLFPSGARLRFGPPNPGHTAFDSVPADSPLSTAGVHVRVYMEQGYIDAYGSGSGPIDVVDGYGDTIVAPRQQLCFDKWSYGVNEVNADLSLDTWITWGQLSSFVFVSDNYLGISETWNDAVIADGHESLSEVLFQPGYGSVSFDPSSAGTGRMILQLCAGQDPAGNDFTDAGFNIYGALLEPRVPSSSRKQAIILNADFRNNVWFNQRAGVAALFRVTDEVSYYERVVASDGDLFDAPANWLTRPISDRRGLVIINHNNSIPHFTNNYENAARIDDSAWAIFNDYEPGFNLGVNGQIEVQPHTFIDYIANNFNREISSAHADLSIYTPDLVKKHNPAAFYTSTLPTFPRRSSHQLDQWGSPISDILYAGGARATVILQGDAGFFVRAAAPNDSGAYVKNLFLQPYTKEFYYLDTVGSGSDTQALTVTLGIGLYDGNFVAITDVYNQPVMQTTELDGVHALDVEGPLSIVSQSGVRGEVAAGFFSVPSIEIDHTGREVGYTNFEQWAAWQSWLTNAGGQPQTVYLPISGTSFSFDSLTSINLAQAVTVDGTSGDSSDDTTVVRPLPTTAAIPDTSSPILYSAKYYSVYDKSTIFLNADLIFDSVNWIHADVTRKLNAPEVLPRPFTEALPHVVGGELASLQNDLYPPLLKLYNTVLDCHESLVVTGAAITVQEYDIGSSSSLSLANNISHIICYNRGREYDKNGYGRVIQLGSQANVASDQVTTNLLYSSAFLDVYRAAPTSALVASNIPPDSPTTIRLYIDSDRERTVTSADRALHSLYLANGSQIHLGWPTLEGDSGYLPAMMDDVVLKQLQDVDPANSKMFRFSPYETGGGALLFNGGPFCIGAGDSIDALPPERPIPGMDVDGVVYVNCGGTLSVTSTTDLFIDTVVGRLKARLLAATGTIIAPEDQVYFLANGSIQDYGIDFTTDQNIDGPYANNIVMSVVDKIHSVDVPELYETSDEEPIK
ncbi:MAG: hypothetical protein QG604_540 [Candidatus Dependentiae bacterium]|nr:hypothetical protein [Candidatus Dependentiae bacterium]